MSLVPVCDICGKRIEPEPEPKSRDIASRRPADMILLEQVFEDICSRCDNGIRQTILALRGKPPTVPEDWTGGKA